MQPMRPSPSTTGMEVMSWLSSSRNASLTVVAGCAVTGRRVITSCTNMPTPLVLVDEPLSVPTGRAGSEDPSGGSEGPALSWIRPWDLAGFDGLLHHTSDNP